ncbi:site-2 protease family protein [Thermogladius sp.]|uniref:site-2 protease family protein n=1 Tax=Thermogladius sp. TaxID=2023064 RepID=UPI003D10B00C
MSWLVGLSEPVALLVGGLAVSLAFGSGCLLGGSPACFAVAAVASFLAVVPHELAHRNTARRMGCWSRYVLSPIGLLVTLATSLPFVPVKFVMPGFTLVSPPTYDREELRRIDGLVSLAGPLYNIAVSIASVSVLQLAPGLVGPLLASALYNVGYVNAWVALFNLLPVPPLDGSKVLKWKPVVYLVVIAVSALLYFFYFTW